MRSFSRVVTALAFTVLGTIMPAALAAQDLAAKVQAEFIERFTRFIEWPEGTSVADTSVPFVIGVIGESPIEAALRDLAGRTTIKGKRVSVRRVGSAAEVNDTQILFVALSEAGQLPEILRKARSNGVLTVSSTPGFGERGVVINFVSEGEFIRFEVNAGAASATGLRLAPELLNLGKQVG